STAPECSPTVLALTYSEWVLTTQKATAMIRPMGQTCRFQRRRRMGRAELVRRFSTLGAAAALAIAVLAGLATATAQAAGLHQAWHASGYSSPPLRVKVIGHLRNGQPKVSSTSPTGLPPSAVASVYNLSGLSPSSGAGAGQIIAIVD